MSDSFIDDLRDLPSFNQFDAPAASPHKAIRAEGEAPTFPCESCNGTGLYRGARIHQEKTHCFACKGKGYFKMSRKDREAQRAKSRQRKERVLDEGRAAFVDQHPTIIPALTEMIGWNDYARSLVEQFNARGSLSEKQVAGAERMIAKVEATRKEKAEAKTARVENAPVVDMSAIERLFETAKSSGLKKPKFHAGDMKISLAPANGRNAGALYIVRDPDEYQGKVLGGKFLAVASARADTLALLLEIASNPAEQARMYGKRTGVCCCCGRELTDPRSVEAGIGPICADNWGL